MSTLREKFAQAIKETIDKTSYYVWTRPTESDPYVIAVDGDVDAGAIADALLPLIREAQAEALEDFSKRWHAWIIDDAPQIRGGAAYRARAAAGEYREKAAAYRVGEEADHG